MITKFIRKRNQNATLPFNKLSAKVQVNGGNGYTFHFKKIAINTGDYTPSLDFSESRNSQFIALIHPF